MKKNIAEAFNLDTFSVFVVKTEFILSIGYFIMVLVFQSTLISDISAVKALNTAHNFMYLGFVNFFSAIVLGMLFNLKNKKNIKNK